jgi:hypothetical protein
MGSRANKAYWDALKKSDALVASAPVGVLPERLHEAMNQQLLPVIDQILEQARNLVVSYQRSVDAEMVDLAKATARRDSFNLSLLYIVFLSSGLFLFFNLRLVLFFLFFTPYLPLCLRFSLLLYLPVVVSLNFFPLGEYNQRLLMN